MFLRAGCSLLRAEGFSDSLDVLYEGLEKSTLKFLIKQIWYQIFSPAENFLKLFVIKTLDPDRYSA
jgi:hypothetical protein